MKQRTKKLLSFILTVMMVLPLIPAFTVQAAGLTLPNLISDNMLIQRDMPIKLWGYGGTPGESIKIEIEDYDGNKVNEKTVTIGVKGGFKTELTPMEAGGPYKIFFINAEGKKIKSIYNVLVGDLWFQGGQSNMQYRISGVPEDVEERVNPNPKNDTIRLFYNGEHFSSTEAKDDLPGKWIVADKNLQDYSAVGYRALEEVHNALDIPVGGICSVYGGTSILNFNSADSEIYKAKVAPATNFNIKGVMWYQGGTDRAKSAEKIEEMYTQLISLLRNKWNNDSLPFVMVQHHPSGMKQLKYGSDTELHISDYSNVRLGIGNVYAKDENVGMAVAMDLSLTKYRAAGEDPSHPWIKEPVGERLGKATLELAYGKDVKGKSPFYTGKKIDGSKLVLTFKDTYDGLKTTDGKAPWGFMVAGEDGVYYEANAVLSGNTVTLSSDKVANPQNASYGMEKHYWPYKASDDPESIAAMPDVCELFYNTVNSAEMPMAAFDTAVSVGTTEETDTPSQPETPGVIETPTEAVTGGTVKDAGERTIYYVATDGKDTNDGSIKKPFATVEKARDQLREDRKAGKIAKGGAVVYIRGGDYLIQKGMTFTKEDSGTKDAPVIFRNYPDEKVNFTGAAKMNWEDFKPVTDQEVLDRVIDDKAKSKIVEISLFDLGYKEIPEPFWPGAYSYSWGMRQVHGKTAPDAVPSELIINGNAMTIARYPNGDFMTIADVLEPGANVRNWYDDYREKPTWVKPEDRKPTPFTITFQDNRVKKWVNAKDALISGTFYHAWADQTVPIKEINAGRNAITSKYPSEYTVKNGQFVYVYNLIEEIDIPGEYFIDREKGILYLYPPAETVKEVIYTTLEDNMFTISASNFELKGINMSYMRAGAVRMSDCENSVISDCEIFYTGKQAGTIRGNNNLMYNCYIHDCAQGVSVGGGDRKTLTSSNNVLEHCTFERCDRLTKTYSPAIHLEGVGNVVRYNKISDADHTVLQFSGNFNIIEYNEIFNAVQNADDMGAIYSGRNLTMRGNIIRYNYFHDIGGTNRGTNGCHGIFLDDWFSAADVVGNVFSDIHGGVAVMCAGSYNVIDNNICVNIEDDCTFNLNRSFNYDGVDSFVTYIEGVKAVPYLSEPWVKAFPEIVNVIDENGAPDMNNYIVCTNNVYVNSPPAKISAQIAKTITHENNISFAGDPGFYDFENRNYLLNPNSEIFVKNPNFKPIPFTRIGNYSKRAISRVKNAFVFSADTPYKLVNGEKLKADKNEAIARDGSIYLALRTGVEVVGANIEYDEATEMITIGGTTKEVSFKDGEKAKVLLNGTEYKLEKPLININDSNYISVQDLAKIFGKQLVISDGIAVLSDIEALFNLDADKELLAYYENLLSIY